MIGNINMGFNYKMVWVECGYCCRMFNRSPNKLREGKKHYCSMKCYNFAKMKGSVK